MFIISSRIIDILSFHRYHCRSDPPLTHGGIGDWLGKNRIAWPALSRAGKRFWRNSAGWTRMNRRNMQIADHDELLHLARFGDDGGSLTHNVAAGDGAAASVSGMPERPPSGASAGVGSVELCRVNAAIAVYWPTCDKRTR